MKVNTTVKTPLGLGISQGRYAVQDSRGELIVSAILVRLPINEQTTRHLKRPNCLTPNAKGSALFTFEIQDIDRSQK